MANLKPLTDLSTVDIQAIQDSGPVHPRILLPPLTTIAENWDSVESSSKNLTMNDESCSEDDEDDDSEQEERTNSSPVRTHNRNSHRTSCSSSSTSDSETDSSESELSDATSDSAESSSSSSDSGSESHSSASSASNQSRNKIKTQPAANNPNKANFSVREANYDRGRVTLRLSTLQLMKQMETNANPIIQTSRNPKVENGDANCETRLKSVESERICGTKNHLHDSRQHTAKKSKENPYQRLKTPVKRSLTRQQSSKPSSESLRREPRAKSSDHAVKSVSSPNSVKPISKQKSGKERDVLTRKKRYCSPPSANIHTSLVKEKTHVTTSVSPSAISSSSFQSHPVKPPVGPCLSDLDSDSDELYLPAVSEAIRMLDLDSQGSLTNTTTSETSRSTLPQPNLLQLPIGLYSNGLHASSSWSTIGYCSSTLQQFAAKSQLGEPPPPPPPTLMLPTKGARKCFPPNDEPLASLVPTVADSKSAKRISDLTRPQVNHSVIVAPTSGGVVVHADHELEMMVPLRGLDCHPSHVSPDSGIQSVSGSPFSVHSSPVHSSGTSCTMNPSGGQTSSLVVSPCPPISSPTPPIRPKSTSRKPTGNNRNNSDTTKSKAEKKCKATASRQQNGSSRNRNRRPRSCRDTVSALSSGLGKDSSIVQAIQRGSNAAALVLNHTKKDVDNPKQSELLPCQQEITVHKKMSKKKKKSSVKESTERNTSPVANNELTPQKTPLDPDNNDECRNSTLMIVRQGPFKPTNELKAEVARSPSPRHHKRKKKHKKRSKGSVRDHFLPVTVDPALLSTLDQLCNRLNRCAISRSTSSSGLSHCDKKPWIFQCRKYTIPHGSNAGSSNRNKRKKMSDDVVSNPIIAPIKRKGKQKKTACQSVPVLSTSNVEACKESEPRVVPIAAAAAAAATMVMTPLELLLPLKKRHHHLTQSDGVSAVESVPNDLNACKLPSEKPSQEQPLHKTTATQQPSSRKRVANKEGTADLTDVTTAHVDLTERKNQVTSAQKGKKERSQKKAKTDVIAEVIAAVAAGLEEERPALDEHSVVQKQTDASLPATPMKDEISGPNDSTTNKKKSRRRKTFNRTGFPSVKKKRKKPPTPLPPSISAIVDEIPSQTSDDILNQPVANENQLRNGKRPKLETNEEDNDGFLAEPTSSEAPSGDESNHPPLPLSECSQPKKRRMSSVATKKRYLPAGLLSNFFKMDSETSGSSTSTSERSKLSALTYDPEEHQHGLLPAPFYCERILRRTRRDFQLPFDIWSLHQQGKLPKPDVQVPSWNYRKIRSNVYYDVKPPFTNDAEPCNCTLPPPDAPDAEARCCGDDCLNRMVYTECSSQMCPVGDKCMNQRIQRHRWAQGLERFMTKEKGWGVRCRSPLKAGVFILEYVGEVVSDKEFKERMHTVYVHDTHHYCLHLDGGLVIDGHRMGGDGRFVNHSCAPNCEMQKWSVNGLPRMALFALRDISPLEELSYDYNFSLFNPAEGQPCKCGSPQCRGVIGGKSQRVNVLQGQDLVGSKLPQKLSLQKRKRKNQLQGKTSLAICTSSINLRPLSTQQRAFVLEHRCFLLRNLDKVRDWRDRQKDRMKLAKQQNLNQTTIGRTRRFISRPAIDVVEKDEVPAVLPESLPVDTEKPAEPPALKHAMMVTDDTAAHDEEIVRCRCKLFDDEGLMVQCEKCETWQHSDCLGPENAKAAMDAEHYVCNSCSGIALRRDDLKIVLAPQPENSSEGLTFFLSLYYKDLHLRQGDCVYVIRDHDTPDSEKTLWSGISSEAEPMPRPPHHLPAHIKLANLDIFQIERMYIDENGKQFVWGHHFFRPQDTFHEPSRKFYVNEVLSSPIYEPIPIWAVAGRCWVLDPTTFCKGRPVDAVEEHVYICEYRVDRTARLFYKNGKSKFPFCTRRFAFKSFVTRLKPQRTFQPHGAPPANSRKSTGPPADKVICKNDKSGKDKVKKLKKETTQSALSQSAPSNNAAPLILQNKVEEQKIKLDQLLRLLLVKNTPEGSPVEDATHLLHRGRGRMRGRPSKQKSQIK